MEREENRLLVVIPAYNEEGAISSIVSRCLDARESIVNETAVSSVQVTVVSDGSHDRTTELAREFEPQINVISYEHNKGYGAAIKIGFESNESELVSFLDADGTCDPLNFVPMIQQMEQENLDVVLGSRMGPDSKMPFIRRVGNLFYRSIVNTLAHANVQDVASGMRVIRRSSLPNVSPLPNGLEFTPVMSCRAVMDPNLSIGEIPMSYRERVGRSKLSVVKDGFRFLSSIINVAITFQPFKFIAPLSVLLGGIALCYAVPLTLEYMNTSRSKRVWSTV